MEATKSLWVSAPKVSCDCAAAIRYKSALRHLYGYFSLTSGRGDWIRITALRMLEMLLGG